MDTFAEIIKDNARENAHLRKLVESLSDENLRLPLEAGWSVSAVLAHLAFWDQRVITLIGKWEKARVGPSPIDTDVVNEATRRLCLAIPPHAAAGLTVELADEVDKLIADLTPEMVQAIQAKGNPVKLRRADHRRTHLGEIEKMLEGRQQ
jgi:DinB superfamily